MTDEEELNLYRKLQETGQALAGQIGDETTVFILVITKDEDIARTMDNTKTRVVRRVQLIDSLLKTAMSMTDDLPEIASLDQEKSH